MKSLLLVAAGGAAGCVLRYATALLVAPQTITWRFLVATFVVNVLGCLIAGLVIGLAETRAFLTADVRIVLFTGFLGGFTTFSAFGVETVSLLEKGELLVAIGYVGLSVLCGLAALWAAVRIGGAV
jgi:fluoride exporter